MSNRYWFKPKVFGYGATPTTWEGWAVVSGYCIMIAVATYVALVLIEPSGEASGVQWALWGIWGLVLLVATALLTIISRRRTDGEWRWRWGRRADVSLRERWKASSPGRSE
jgi:hypothetical protein